MVRAVRGATTVESDDIEEIIAGTVSVLKKMVEENKIETDDIISVIFTMTHDLNAGFPAAAARRLGWTDVALMCMNEIDVPGSLKKCIRILMHINTEKKNTDIRHIYLKEARELRPDLVNKTEDRVKK